VKITKFIPSTVTRKVARSILTTKKNSPHIFFVAGIAGVVTSTVLACKATLKLEATLDELNLDVELVKANRVEEEHSKELAYVYGMGSAKIVVLYAPAVAVGALSIAALAGSHVALTRRNTALTAAYAGIAKAYSEYRDRVREELGTDKELDIYHGVLLEKVKGEDGKSLEIKTIDPNKTSPYARFFDEYSPNWQKNAELNKLFVQCQQNWLNHRLIATGHVFLNEAYDALGIPRSSAGQIVGWVISDIGDNYIDFGMFEARNARFVEGWERSILLDFNVDGVIYDKI
jgi:hypothetical protein